MSRRRSLLTDEAGGALVEFALVLPLMIAMLAGSVELVAGFQAQRKAYHVAFAVADIVAQTGMTDTDILTKTKLDDDFVAGQTLMDPLPTGSEVLTQTVASFTADDKGKAVADWVYPAGASITPPPDGFMKPKQSLIAAEATYLYHPFTDSIWPVGAALTFTKQAYLQPRYLTKIPAPQ